MEEKKQVAVREPQIQVRHMMAAQALLTRGHHMRTRSEIMLAAAAVIGFQATSALVSGVAIGVCVGAMYNMFRVDRAMGNLQAQMEGLGK
jgi:hypothetical protein